MSRHLLTLAAVILTAAPLAAEPPLANDNRSPLERLDQIEQQIKRLDEKLSRLVEQNAMNSQREMSDLREIVNHLRREVADVRNSGARDYVARKPLEATNATVLLVNENPTMNMTTMVNGATFTVLPLSRQTVNVPVGALSMQVMETDLVARARTIVPGETKVITMR